MHFTLLLLGLLVLHSPSYSLRRTTTQVQQRTIATARRWPVNHLQPRQTGDNYTAFSQQCSTYYSANTPHAVCNGDRSIMCLSGCQGGIVAQNCRSNLTSSPTTQTCSVAFSQTSATSFLCNTPEGAFTCLGPSTGSIACHGCVPTPDGVVPYGSSFLVNDTSVTGAPESHLATGQNQQDSSTTSNRLPKIGRETTFFIFLSGILTYL